MENQNYKGSENRPITAAQAQEMMKGMQEIGRMNEVLCASLAVAVEFIEAKGLKEAYEEYVTARKRGN